MCVVGQREGRSVHGHLTCSKGGGRYFPLILFSKKNAGVGGQVASIFTGTFAVKKISRKITGKSFFHKINFPISQVAPREDPAQL